MARIMIRLLGFTQQFDIILRFLNDDSFAWEIVFKDSVHTQGGDDFKMVEVTYTRSDWAEVNSRPAGKAVVPIFKLRRFRFCFS